MKKRLLIAGIIALSASALAASSTWTNGTPTDALWTNTANWVGGVVQTGNNTAFFTGSSVAPATAVDLTGMQAVKTVTFNGADETFTFGSGTVDSQTWVTSAGIWSKITSYNNLKSNQIWNATIDATGAGGLNIENKGDFGAEYIFNGQINQGTKAVYYTGDEHAVEKIQLNSTVNATSTGTSRINSLDVTAASISSGALELLNGGTLNLNNDQDIKGVYFHADSSVSGTETLNIGAANTTTLTGNLDYNASTSAGVANKGVIQGGKLDLNASYRVVDVEDNVNVGDADAELTISSTLTSSVNQRSLTKKGAGTLRLTGADNNNETTGIKVVGIQEGKVQFEAAENLGYDDVNMGKLGTGQASALEFIGSTSTVLNEEIKGVDITATQTLLANGATGAAWTVAKLDGNGAAESVILGGENTDDNTIGADFGKWGVSLVDGLTKNGNGTWVFSENQSYTGDTTVNAGTLRLDASANQSDMIVNNGATVKLGNSNVIGDSKDLTINSGGTLDMNVIGRWDDTIGGLSGAGHITGTNGNVLSINSGDFSGTIGDGLGGSDDMQLRKVGTGTLKLSGDNNYNNLIVAEGTVQVTTGDALGSGNWQDQIGDVNDGTVEFVGGSDVTMNHKYSIGDVNGGTDAGGAILKSSLTGTAKVTVSASNNRKDSVAHAARSIELTGENSNLNTYSGTINNNDLTSGLVSLKKTGTGTWVLSGDNTYTGTTTVENGLLVIDGDNSGATGAVTVNAGASLGGSGIIGGVTTIAGMLNPGNSPGVLTFNENLTLEGASTLTLEFATLTSFDQLLNDAIGSDTLTFDNGANIILDFTDAIFAENDTLSVFDGWENLVNSGANISVVGTDSSNLDYSGLLNGGDGTIAVTAAIPEPAVASLVTIFGLGILVLKRRFS